MSCGRGGRPRARRRAARASPLRDRPARATSASRRRNAAASRSDWSSACRTIRRRRQAPRRWSGARPTPRRAGRRAEGAGGQTVCQPFRHKTTASTASELEYITNMKPSIPAAGLKMVVGAEDAGEGIGRGDDLKHTPLAAEQLVEHSALLRTCVRLVASAGSSPANSDQFAVGIARVPPRVPRSTHLGRRRSSPRSGPGGGATPARGGWHWQWHQSTHRDSLSGSGIRSDHRDQNLNGFLLADGRDNEYVIVPPDVQANCVNQPASPEEVVLGRHLPEGPVNLRIRHGTEGCRRTMNKPAGGHDRKANLIPFPRGHVGTRPQIWTGPAANSLSIAAATCSGGPQYSRWPIIQWRSGRRASHKPRAARASPKTAMSRMAGL